LIGFYHYIGYPLLVLDRSLEPNQPYVVFCTKLIPPKEGDLVAFTPPINTAQYGLNKPSGKYVKYLLAINPKVLFKGDTVIVNGKVLQRNIKAYTKVIPIVVSNYNGTMKGYFVIGKVINSIDSRYFGTILHADKCWRIF
jgi:type IV secretory pathway protease TraF